MTRRSRRSLLQLAGGLWALALPARAQQRQPDAPFEGGVGKGAAPVAGEAGAGEKSVTGEPEAGGAGEKSVTGASEAGGAGEKSVTGGADAGGAGEKSVTRASEAGGGAEKSVTRDPDAGGAEKSVTRGAPEAGGEKAASPAERPGLFSGAPEPDDPLELLYSRRLAFDEGQPLITVRILEGRTEATLRALGPLIAFARSAEGKPEPVFHAAPQPSKAAAQKGKAGKAGKPGTGQPARPAAGKLGAAHAASSKAARLKGPPPKGAHPQQPSGPAGKWRVVLASGRPGVGASWVELEQVRYQDKEGREAARALWESRGVKVRLATVGDVYGIAGHVVDTRRWSLLAEGDATPEGAAAQARALGDKWGIRPQIHRELASRPQGLLELLDPSGKVAGRGHGALELRCAQGLAVEQVEFGMGYAFHGFERRIYPGRLFACVDADGKLALVAALPMERLVKGVVPSEIFARAHPEALKAQAVTARGEVLAKVGARHLGDPYLLCAEQHCQVYKGLSAEMPSTDKAVDSTRGEALFAQPQGGEPRRLVDSVYSAVCGGFTEDNDAVWGGPPDPSLRGRPDFPLEGPGVAPFAAAFKDGIGDALVARFVGTSPMPSYCALSGFAPKDKVRWRRSFTAGEVDALCKELGIGTVKAMVVEGRGVSGRARALRLEGSAGTTRVLGELNIRKLFRMLPSGMFVVGRDAGAWVFTGGGWGHGSGMCQTGAIGRAQRGADYRQILGWYYSGASPERVY
jgi:stage II sporulation protein D